MENKKYLNVKNAHKYNLFTSIRKEDKFFTLVFLNLSTRRLIMYLYSDILMSSNLVIKHL